MIASTAVVDCSSRDQKSETIADVMDRIVVWLKAVCMIIHSAF